MGEYDMIYCVEDDNSIRDLMIYTLTIAGFEARGFADSRVCGQQTILGGNEYNYTRADPSGYHAAG